jgi:citrate lyase subunit beta/citryl-CoA lyase
MAQFDPALRRTWLFGPGADRDAHSEMLACGADALIADLEDFTPPARRQAARDLLGAFVTGCRQAGAVAAIRINTLEACGKTDLAAAMAVRPDVVLYPMTEGAAQMQALDAAIAACEAENGIASGSTDVVPVCETALGVVEVRAIVAASPRIRAALLGSEDLVNDLNAERSADAVELDYVRRRFILECRASKVEPIDAPYTYSDIDGARREAAYARRLGYNSKALVWTEQAVPLNAAFTPGDDELRHAGAVVDAF